MKNIFSRFLNKEAIPYKIDLLVNKIPPKFIKISTRSQLILKLLKRKKKHLRTFFGKNNYKTVQKLFRSVIVI